MNKKLFGFLFVSSILLCSCGNKPAPVPSDKTVLRVYGYAGGYGEQWIRNVCERFAEAEKETSFEEGKKGVYFVYTLNKQSPTGSSDIKPTDYDIMLTESSSVNEWYLDGCFEDITDVVTGENKYEVGKTIESKITESQRGTYKWDNKYYFLPTYSGSYGLIYNIDLFTDRNWYFSGENPGEFITSPLEPKSVGPDGEANTYDDGLPVTTADFMKLCDQIQHDNATPVLFSGGYRHQYGANWMYNMAATIDGEAVTRERFDFNGVNNVDVVKVNSGRATGEFEKVNVTKTNGYELFRSRGFYEAFNLCDKIITTGNGKYIDQVNCYKNTVDHIAAQTYFLKAQGSKPYAMLMEGTWWRNEVKANMAKMPGTEKIKFGWMPVPRLEGQTESYYLDALTTAAFIRKDSKGTRSAGTLQAAKDLLRFMYTDESLVDFSVETDTYFSINYSVGSRIEELSDYGKQLFQFKESAHTHILPALSASAESRRNEKKLLPSAANIGFPISGVKTNVADYYYNNKAYDKHADTAVAAFYQQYKDNWDW